MIIARRSSIAFATDSVAQSVRSTIAASARLVSTPPAEASVSSGLALAHLYPALFAPQPQPPLVPAYVRAMSAALSATVVVVLAAVGVHHH